MKNFRKIRTIIVVILMCGFFAYACYMFYQLNLETSRNPIKDLDTKNSDYINLFDQKISDKLILNKTLSFAQRNPISLYGYNKNYSIEITKINLISDMDLSKDIDETYAKSEETGNVIYVPINENSLTVNYRSTSLINPLKIHLTLHGDSIHSIIKNDSLNYYYMQLDDFSIRYDHSNVNEIFGETIQTSIINNKQVILMFFKRHHSLYFILLTKNDLNTKLDPYVLYKLISKNKISVLVGIFNPRSN